MGVFKCLVKMALAVMPSEEAVLCNHLKKWILEKEHTYESFRFTPLKIFTQTISGPLPSDTINYQLLRRKRLGKCPYMVFVISFSNIVLQIMLPMPDQDGELNKNKQLNICHLPNAGSVLDHIENYGNTTYSIVDMSSPCEESSQHFEIHLKFESREELTNTTEK